MLLLYPLLKRKRIFTLLGTVNEGVGEAEAASTVGQKRNAFHTFDLDIVYFDTLSTLATMLSFWTRTQRYHLPCDVNLPTEIWLHILVLAGIKATAVMRLVCKEMNRIGSDEWLWKRLTIKLQKRKNKIPVRTDLRLVTFSSGVTPSWFEFCKMVATGKALIYRASYKVLINPTRKAAS